VGKNEEIPNEQLQGDLFSPAAVVKSLRGYRVTTRTTSRRHALFCSAASYGAYQEEATGWNEAVFQELGFKVTHADEARTDTQIVFLESAEALAVAFRGTKGLADAFTDANLRFFKTGKLNVHNGFWKALDSVWGGATDLGKKLSSASARGKNIVFTSHSLGAALAFLASCRAEEVGIRAYAVMTFGQPHAGAEDFITRFPHTLSVATRFVNARDIVTLIPYDALLKTARWSRKGNKGKRSVYLKYYPDAGRLFYFGVDGEHIPSPSPRFLRKERRRTYTRNIVKFLKPTLYAHAMTLYHGRVQANGDAIDDHL
jgi:predicted lipase